MESLNCQSLEPLSPLSDTVTIRYSHLYDHSLTLSISRTMITLNFPTLLPSATLLRYDPITVRNTISPLALHGIVTIKQFYPRRHPELVTVRGEGGPKPGVVRAHLLSGHLGDVLY